jgi:hypothetical protein
MKGKVLLIVVCAVLVFLVQDSPSVGESVEKDVMWQRGFLRGFKWGDKQEEVIKKLQAYHPVVMYNFGSETILSVRCKEPEEGVEITEEERDCLYYGKSHLKCGARLAFLNEGLALVEFILFGEESNILYSEVKRMNGISCEETFQIKEGSCRKSWVYSHPTLIRNFLGYARPRRDTKECKCCRVIISDEKAWMDEDLRKRGLSKDSDKFIRHFFEASE